MLSKQESTSSSRPFLLLALAQSNNDTSSAIHLHESSPPAKSSSVSPVSSTASSTSMPAFDMALNGAFVVVDVSSADFTSCTVSEISEFDNTDLTTVISKMSAAMNPYSTLVAFNHDIRQIVHPLSARLSTTISNDHQGEWCLPECFYNFISLDSVIEHQQLATNNNNESSATVKPTSLVDRLHNLIQAFLSVDKTEGILEAYGEQVQKYYTSSIFHVAKTGLDNGLVIRTRGLPWQASDQDVAYFFTGLNIKQGGVALCLSNDGRRNGEAIVCFETRAQREMALQRHRQFLHNRYIEVYRATGDDFLKVAVGSDQEAVQFASREAAMIVRMRGLPFDCTAEQIINFFASDGKLHGIIDQGILFVTKPDGRPSGDAFVLFADDAAGKRALSKHKNRIGSRYIELFRTTQAEVQQVFNRTMRSSPPTIMSPHLLGPLLGQKRDCVRLRGLPYEASVKDVATFMGSYARHIAFQGVHMIYNNQGHPSGECFIQMDSEPSAAAAAHSMHNKYMEIGKKKRYIEVFQCSTEEISAILNAASPGAAPNAGPAAQSQQQLSPAVAAAAAALLGGGGNFPMNASLNPAAAAFRPTHQMPAMPLYHPGAAGQGGLTPDQLIFATTQFGTVPLYQHDQFQLAALESLCNPGAAQAALLSHHQMFSAAQGIPPQFVAAGGATPQTGVDVVSLANPHQLALIHT